MCVSFSPFLKIKPHVSDVFCFVEMYSSSLILEFGSIIMGEAKVQIISQGLYSNNVKKNCRAIMEEDDCVNQANKTAAFSSSTTSSSSIGSESTVSNESSFSSFDLTDDASSSSPSPPSSSANSCAALYDLSQLMAQLPIKRGLSKYYEGKCQSYTCLSRVKSIEDVAKKANPLSYRRKIKACKSQGGGLDSYKSYTHPKPIISKKASNAGALLSSSYVVPNKRRSRCKPPITPLHHNKFGC